MLFMIKTNLLLLLMMTKKTTMMIMMMLLMLVVVSVGGAEMMRYDKKWWEMRIQSWYNKGHRDRIHSNEPGINDYDFTKWWPQMCASGMPACLSQVANDAGDNILTKHGCQEVHRLNKNCGRCRTVKVIIATIFSSMTYELSWIILRLLLIPR